MNPAKVQPVEISQYVGQGLRTLVPRVLGQAAEAQRAKRSASPPARQWDEDAFFQELATKHATGISLPGETITKRPGCNAISEAVE